MIVEKFRVTKHKNLSDELLTVLSLCYLPIIGSLSYSMYLLLYSLPTFKHNIDVVCSILNIDRETFIDSIKKLETVGLINRYESIDEYYFELNGALTKEGFFNSILLTNLLKQQINHEVFDYLCKEDIQTIPENFVLSSAKFDDFYTVVDNKIVLSSKFDFEMFLSKMKNNRNKDYTKFSEKIVSVLEQIHYLYKFDESNLALIYEKSKDTTEELTINRLNFNANILAQKLNIDNIVVPIDSSLEGVLDNENPNTIISKFSNYYYEDLDIVNKLLTKYDLPFGVLNYLILNVYKNKGELPNYNYCEKIVQTLIKSGIKTSNEAKLYFDSIQKKYNNKGKKSANWVDSFIDDEIGDFK